MWKILLRDTNISEPGTKKTYDPKNPSEINCLAGHIEADMMSSDCKMELWIPIKKI